MLDLYGYGPLIKAISFAFLCYSVVFTNSKVPIMFFVLYGIGSLAFLTHLFAIKASKTSPVDAGIYEQYFNIVLSLITILFILKNK